MKKIIGLSMLICLLSGMAIASQTNVLTKKMTINVGASNLTLRANDQVAYRLSCSSGRFDMFEFRPILYIFQYDQINLSDSENININGNSYKAVVAKRLDNYKNCNAIVAKFEDKRNQVDLTIYDSENYELNFR